MVNSSADMKDDEEFESIPSKKNAWLSFSLHLSDQCHKGSLIISTCLSTDPVTQTSSMESLKCNLNLSPMILVPACLDNTFNKQIISGTHTMHCGFHLVSITLNGINRSSSHESQCIPHMSTKVHLVQILQRFVKLCLVSFINRANHTVREICH